MINQESVPKKKETDPNMPGRRNFVRKGFATIELVSRIVLAIVVRFWRLCTTGLLVIILLFCVHGGILAFSFLVLGILGKPGRHCVLCVCPQLQAHRSRDITRTTYIHPVHFTFSLIHSHHPYVLCSHVLMHT